MDLSLSDALVRLADAVGAARDPADLYDGALTALVDVTGVDRASILLFDPDGVMRFKAWRGLSDRYRAAVEGHTPWSPGQPPPEPIVVSDVFGDTALADYAGTFREECIGSLAFVPIISRRQVVGKFMLYQEARQPFTDRQVTAALHIGYHIGFAVVSASAMREEALARERLALLTEASQKLLGAPSVQSVAAEVLTLAQRVISADAYAVWRRQGDTWRIAASRGVSDEFTRQSLIATSTRFDAVVVAPDVMQSPTLEHRQQSYAREGIVSLVSVPLPIHGAPRGSVVFYYRRRHTPSEMDVRVAGALGHLAAAAMSNAELHAEQERLRLEATDAEIRAAFLAEASAILSSLDYEENLRRVAGLMVPRVADWCAVDLLTDQGSLARLAVAHVDPEKIAYARDLQRRYPTSLDAPGGIARVLRTGEPELYPEITDEMLVASAIDAEHLRLMRELALHSAMLVPLTSGRRTFGAISFVTARGGRRYGVEDLAFASELARRAALAIDNARLYAEAQEANRLKDEFLATLSHELRTPLNVILGRTRMLTATPIDADAMKHLADTIDRNAQSLARLVEDLLDVSRISLGRVTVEARPLQMPAIVDAVVTSLEPMARAKGVTVTTTSVNGIPPLLGDATRLQQVVWNLLTNAIKFTPAGGQVSVSIEPEGSQVVVTVRDTGEGIAPEFLPYVFDMFRQAETAAHRRYGGLGLGLSIVRRLVELHGGTVTVDSAGPGRGTTFCVRLPGQCVIA